MGDIAEMVTLEQRSESRVRMNLKQTAKGETYFDITAEFPSAEEAAAALSDAIDLVRTVCTAKELKLADATA